MDIKKFVLSYYSNATEDFHINEITKPGEALSLHNHEYYQIYYLKSGRLTKKSLFPAFSFQLKLSVFTVIHLVG